MTIIALYTVAIAIIANIRYVINTAHVQLFSCGWMMCNNANNNYYGWKCSFVWVFQLFGDRIPPIGEGKNACLGFFGFPAHNGKFLEMNKTKRQSVHCKLCKHALSYRGNTTNMLVHLQYHHKSEYSEVTSKLTLDSEWKLGYSNRIAVLCFYIRWMELSGKSQLY